MAFFAFILVCDGILTLWWCSGFPTEISETTISGVHEAFKQLVEAGAIDPVVKASIVISESGFVKVREAFAFGEIKDDSFTGKLRSLLNKGDGASTDEERETEVRPESTSVSGSSSAGVASESLIDGEKEGGKKEKPRDTIPLKVETKWTSLAPMSSVEKKTARDR